ncbi:MAG TPA: 4-phosphoerythronate dehydrogenase [Bacteroidetes bacterium]|nr:4-phosphoerythronate dehydrogenase [Bacteroidota bacterium]
MKIVVNKNTPCVVEMFSHLGAVVALDTPAVTRQAVHDADMLIVRSETIVNKDLLERSAVRFVGSVTIGTDHVDLAYLASRGIAFASAPGSNSASVAEYVAAALLMWMGRTDNTLKGKSIGIVGVGNVGSKVVRVAEALGMNVLLNDPPLARLSGDPKYLTLDELMGADFVTLHVPLTKSGPDPTYHLFSDARIGNMGRNSVLVNTSRGAVVETSALRQALASHRLSAAILDVWEREPSIDLDLLSLVMIGTPHIAGYSLDGKLNALRLVHEEACRFLGVPSEGKSGEPSASSDLPRIEISSNLTEDLDVVHAAVRAAYDIESDDKLLRHIGTMKEEERDRYFMRLRAEYRVRREFFHRVVDLLPEQATARRTLHQLGFKTTLGDIEGQ